MTTELIGYFEGEERADEQAEEELPWTSREVLAGAGFSEKSDVYSFGIILWELMQKEPGLPYAGLVPSEVRVCVAAFLLEHPCLPRFKSLAFVCGVMDGGARVWVFARNRALLPFALACAVWQLKLCHSPHPQRHAHALARHKSSEPDFASCRSRFATGGRG